MFTPLIHAHIKKKFIHINPCLVDVYNTPPKLGGKRIIILAPFVQALLNNA
jgi:hypothetical protein